MAARADGTRFIGNPLGGGGNVTRDPSCGPWLVWKCWSNISFRLDSAILLSLCCRRAPLTPAPPLPYPSVSCSLVHSLTHPPARYHQRCCCCCCLSRGKTGRQREREHSLDIAGSGGAHHHPPPHSYSSPGTITVSSQRSGNMVKLQTNNSVTVVKLFHDRIALMGRRNLCESS